MSDQDWTRAFELFDAAVERPLEDRALYLDQVCGEDKELRREVESLLSSHEETRGPLDHPDSLAPLLVGSVTDDLVGRTIGPYEIESVLGDGGMGIVCAARQRAPLERQVALKLIKVGMDTDEVVRRFESERQTLALMDHPNIAQVHDAGATAEGRPYFVMELIEGQPITEYCDLKRLSVPERLELFLPVCAAVQHAHQKGIIHRDLKPSNVLVAVHEGQPLPKVIDFGIAKATDPRLSAGAQLTRHGLFVGTPEYMSPEQAGSGLDVDTRSDVYSLGVLLYRLLSGVLPFRAPATGLDELQRRGREREPPTPSTRVSQLGAEASSVAERRSTAPERLRRQLKGELDWIVMMAMAAEPDLRYGSAAELAADLRRHLADQPIEAGPPGALYRVGKFVHRHRVGVAAAALLALVAAVSLAAITVQSLRLARALDSAEVERLQADQERRSAEAVAGYLEQLFQDARADRGGQILSVRELLDRGAERIDEELAGQDDVRARVLSSLGIAYMSLAELDRAESLLAAGLDIRRQAPDSYRTAELLWRLALVDRQRGDLALAEERLREALEIQRRVPTPGRDAAGVLTDLGALLGERGESEEAAALIREGLAVLHESDPSDHRLAAIGQDQLASLLHRRGLYDQAIDAYDMALAEWRAAGGEQVEAGHTLQNLGALLVDRGDYERAETVLREALELRRRHYGAEHPGVATVLNNLALLRNQAGSYEAAAQLYLEALEINRNAYGERHFAVAINVNNLGLAYLEAGNLGDAEHYLDQALMLQRELAGEEHPNVAFPLTNLGRVYQNSGRRTDAEHSYRLGLDLRRAALPAGHPQLAGSLFWLGRLLVEQGRAEEAEPLLREAVEIRRDKLAPDDWRNAEARSLLGACLIVLARFDEAEPLLVDGYQQLHEQRGEDWRGTREALARVVELYAARGMDVEAARYRALDGAQ